MPLSPASMPGHRSWLGSIDRGSSRSVVTVRRSLSEGPVMSVHLHAESLTQELASAMQLRFAGALGDAEHLRGLDVRVPVQGMQYECIAGPFGERTDRGLDLVHLDGGLQRPVGNLAFLLLLERRLDPSALAALGQADVDRDAVQPGRQRAARLEFPERAPGIDESVLRTILRQLSVTRHPQTQSVDP